MEDPKRRACEKCEKEECPYYMIDEITGSEICWCDPEDEREFVED